MYITILIVYYVCIHHVLRRPKTNVRYMPFHYCLDSWLSFKKGHTKKIAVSQKKYIIGLTGTKIQKECFPKNGHYFT